MQTTQSDAALKKEKKVGYSIAGSLSIFLHLGIFLLIGGTIILEQHRTPNPMPTGEISLSPPVDKPEDTPPPVSNDLPPSVDEPQIDSPPVPKPFNIEVITTNQPSNSQNFLPPGTSQTPNVLKLPDVSGNPDHSPTRKPTTIFNLPVQSNKFGVILDCSGSAHPFLMAAFREIDKNFENAPTVLAMGCGMGSPKDVRVELYGKIRPDKEKDKIGARTTLGQLALAEKTNKDLERYLDRMKKRDNVWAIEGGDIFATAYGFEELIKQGVDTIYWFSDLQDSIDPKVIENLTAELKRKGIKVIVHNFSGKPVTALTAKIAVETGGATISQVPK